MTPTQTLIPLIVRALTPAQRRALIWLSDEWQFEAKRMSAPLWALTCKRMVPDIRACLAAHRSQPEGRIWVASEWRLTSLGQAVRAAIGGGDV